MEIKEPLDDKFKEIIEPFDDKFKEFKENIKESVNDRISNPFFLVFITVLLIYNWDIILNLFFHDGSTQQKIDSITKQLKDTSDDYFINLRVLYPLFCGLISYIIFKLIYFFYGKIFGVIELGIIASHYDKIDTKVRGERTVFESKLGIKEIEDLNKRIENHEKEKDELNNDLDKERKNTSKLNNDYTDLNHNHTLLQRNHTSLTNDLQKSRRELNKLQIENENLLNENGKMKFDIDATNNENERLKQNLRIIGKGDDKNSLKMIEKSILNILSTNLPIQIINKNGDFNFINHIKNSLDDLKYFSKEDLTSIVLKGFKNLYLENSRPERKYLFYEDLTLKDSIHQSLVSNSYDLANYLYDNKISKINIELTNTKNINIYELI